MSLVAKIVKVKQAGGRGGLSKYYSTTKMTQTPLFCKGEKHVAININIIL